MKIGLISINMYSKKLNFACPLHTYAFQHFLMENGIESTVIDYKPVYYNNFNLRHPYEYYKEKCDNLINSNKHDANTKRKIDEFAKKRDAYKNLYREREIRYEKFQNFIDAHYIKTEECYDSDLLEVSDPGFDCYICVTDVIWKNEPGEGFDRGFFLAGKAMENKWKISYAASRGVHFSNSHESETEFLYYIDDIDYISVREESLKNYIEEKSSKTAAVVLDPVLLNNKMFYEKLARKPKEKRYILLYYVVERATDTIRMAVEYARANNIKIVELTDFPYSGRLDHYEGIDKIYRYDIGIEEWLGYIMYADCVFTNSFHGTCFSILFEKNFFVGKRNGDKITNLLDMLELSNRRVSTFEEISHLSGGEINYSEINKKLNQKREESRRFILNAIEECKTKKRKYHDYEWWKRAQNYKIIYHSGGKFPQVTAEKYEKEEGKTEILSSGNIQYYPNKTKVNNGYSRFDRCEFVRPGYDFQGWRIRFRIDKKWFWYLENETIKLKDSYSKKRDGEFCYFKEGDRIPFLPVNHISLMVAEAGWITSDYIIAYNCGKSKGVFTSNYDTEKGTLTELPSGSIEFRPSERIKNNGKSPFLKNKFIISDDYKFRGWKIRIRSKSEWFWYMENDSLLSKTVYDRSHKGTIKYFRDNEVIPKIKIQDFDMVVAEAVWEKIRYRLLYNSGKKSSNYVADYDIAKGGTLTQLPSGSVEYCPAELAYNTGKDHLLKNKFSYDGYQFVGWKIRIKAKKHWYWYMEDGSLELKDDNYKKGNVPIKIFSDEESIPIIFSDEIEVAVAEAVWRSVTGRWSKFKKYLK